MAPMYALFEEAGKFQTGRILSEAESSAQIELESGKRVKVKGAHVLLKFDKPSPADLMRDAQALSATIELELAWEFAPEDEFGFADLAHEYFSAQATLTEQTAALFRLYEAPHYFRRAGKGRFKKASAEVIAQALAGIEKKKQIQAQIEDWAAELGEGTCPAPIQTQLYKILFKPDKNASEYKAVVEAARATQTAPLALLQKAGAITSAYQFHWQRFLFDNFPKGTGFPSLQAPAIADALPLAHVQAYSIDDSQTTEIDDALSVQGLGTGTVTLGIHIAAPALALKPGDAIDQLGRQRLSTVYMPGYKITMLPDEVVQTYTLQEGRDCPAVSLYVTFDEARSRCNTPKPASSACPSRPTCVMTNSMPSSPKHGCKTTASRTTQAWWNPPCHAHSSRSCSAWRNTSKRNAKWCAASLRTSTAPTTTFAWWATTAKNPRAMSKCTSASANAVHLWT